MELLCVLLSPFLFIRFMRICWTWVYLRFHWSKNSVSVSDNQRHSNIQNSTEIALAGVSMFVCVCMSVCECTYMNGFELLGSSVCFVKSAYILLHNPVVDIIHNKCTLRSRHTKKFPIPLLCQNIVYNSCVLKDLLFSHYMNQMFLIFWSQRNAHVYILTHNMYLLSCPCTWLFLWVTVIIPVDLMQNLFFVKAEGSSQHCCTSESSADRWRRLYL